MKKLFLFIILFFGILTANAEEFITTNLEQSYGEDIVKVDQCSSNKYDLVGDFNLKQGSATIFSIKNNLIGESDSGFDVVYTLKKDDEVIEESDLKNFNYKFEEIGNYSLNAMITEVGQECEYSLEKSVNVYKKIVSFITDRNNININLDEDFKKNDLFLNEISFTNKSSVLLQDVFLSEVAENLTIFNESDIFIINSDSYLQFLQGFEKLKNVYNVDFSNKKIYIITDSNVIFTKKLLNNYIGSLSSKIYTLPNKNLLNFLNYISTGNSSEDIISDKDYEINVISYSSEENKLLIVTNFINKLISNGFPMGILGVIFAMSLAVTVINFIRQFIGFSIFSLYYPIFIALSIYIFSFNLTIVLIISALISIYLLSILLNKTRFLLNTKLSLYFILYLIFSLLIIFIANNLGLIDFGDLSSNMIIFPFTIIPMVIYRVFADEDKVFSWGFLIYVFEFIFIIFVSYAIIKSIVIQNIFLAYSELVILMFFLNYLIGKFTGLQFLEYIRFLPLIKKLNTQEEEEE